MCTDSCELTTVNMSDFEFLYDVYGLQRPMQTSMPEVSVDAGVSDDVPVSQSSGINYGRGARMLGSAALNAGLSALIGYGLTQLVKKVQKKKTKKQARAFKKGGVVKKKAVHKKVHKKAGKR